MTDHRTPTSDPVAAGRDYERLNELRDAIIDAVRTQNGVGGLKAFAAYDDFIEAEARQQARAAFAAQPLDMRSLLSIARGRVDAGIDGRGDAVVWQRLAEDLDAALALLAASPEPASPEAPGSGLREADAERLAEAIFRVGVGHRRKDEPDRALSWAVDHQQEWAGWSGVASPAIAAEYDRLAARPDASPGSGLDAETDCDHPKVGPMAPDFPGEWACYRCGQRFMPQNAARPDGAEADAS